MNLLIIGGLLVIAVAAILGAIILGISEQRTEKSRTNGVTVATSRPVSTTPAAEQSASTGRVAERPVPTRQGFIAPEEQTLRIKGESQQLSALNGQFHELATELRTLYQQAWELERKLRGLTEMADRIEDRQSSLVSIEEEARSHSATDSPTL